MAQVTQNRKPLLSLCWAKYYEVFHEVTETLSSVQSK